MFGKSRELRLNEDKKILILGGSSYVGRHLFTRLGPAKAIATYYRSPIEGGVYFDSVSMKLSDIVKNPEVVLSAVILLGDTDPESCAADIAKSHILNVDSIKSILEYLKHWRVKPIFISSEFVFDGIKGNYVETDPVNPILTYGRQKVEVEKYLQDNFDEFVILRLSKVFSSEQHDGTIFSNWLEDIQQGRTINCANDQIFSPVYVEDVVEGIIRVIDSDSNGIFHLAGGKPFVRIELMEMLLNYVKEYLPVKIEIIPKSIHDFNLREKRPLNVSMKPDKLIKTTKLKISDVEDICKQIVKKAFQKQ